MSTVGRRLLSAFIKQADIGEYVRSGMHAGLFRDGEAALYSFINNHLKNFGAIPTPDTIEEKLGDVLVDTPEPISYYMHEVEQRFLQTKLKEMITTTSEFLTAKDPVKAMEQAIAKITELHVVRHRRHLIDFREIGELLYREYKLSQNKDKTKSLFFGWESLDKDTGGLGAGDMLSIVGRPASGKTFLELFMAEYGWNKFGQVPLFISLEMTILRIGQRIAAMNSHTHLTHLLKGMMTYKQFNKLKDVLALNKHMPNPFWLADNNMAKTPDDVIMLVRQLKPTSVFIDAAYLLEATNKKLGRFERITENAEIIKQNVATDLGVPVVCSYQFNRDMKKKKKTEAVGLEDIYGSDAIGQLSSVVLGLLEEESIETQKRRKVSVLKGRNGEVGEFLINWDFYGMNFNEIPTMKTSDGKTMEDTSQMQFVM